MLLPSTPSTETWEIRQTDHAPDLDPVVSELVVMRLFVMLSTAGRRRVMAWVNSAYPDGQGPVR